MSSPIKYKIACDFEFVSPPEVEEDGKTTKSKISWSEVEEG